MLISVVVPCHNEEKVIENTYREIKRVMSEIEQKNGADYEIIFEEDGSVDRTSELIQGFAKSDQHVTSLSFPGRKMGLGWGWKQLLRAAKGDYIIMTDADMSVRADIFKDFIVEIKNNDIVIASRYKRSPVHKVKLPIGRRLASRVYYLINYLLFRMPIRDSQSGFQIYNRKVVDSINLETNGFEINLELLIKAVKRGFKIKEIPCEFEHREEGAKFNILRDGPRTLLDTFAMWRRLRDYPKSELRYKFY